MPVSTIVVGDGFIAPVVPLPFLIRWSWCGVDIYYHIFCLNNYSLCFGDMTLNVFLNTFLCMEVLAAAVLFNAKLLATLPCA